MMRLMIFVVLLGFTCGCGPAGEGLPGSHRQVPISSPQVEPRAGMPTAATRPALTGEAIPLTGLIGDGREAEDLARFKTPPMSKLLPTPAVVETPRAETRPSPKTPPAQPRIVTVDKPVSPAKTVVDDADNGKVVALAVLQVNDQFITIDEVLAAAGPNLRQLPKGISDQMFRKKASGIIADEVRNLLTETMVLTEAQKRLTDTQKEQIELDVTRELREMIVGAGGSRSRLEDTLKQQGTNLDTVLAGRRRRLTVQMFLRDRFMPSIFVNRRMLWDYYRRHQSRFAIAPKVQMQIIAAPFKSLLPPGSFRPTDLELQAARVKARQRIDEAARALRSEQFADVAKLLSGGIMAKKGGIWPMMEAGSFRETKVEQEAFKLAEGKVSGIIETDSGYYIVKAKRVEAGNVIPFEQAQEKIEQIITERQYRKLSEDYFKRLLKSATVVQSGRFVELAVKRAAANHRRR